jgi:nicotinamidase-related amidase
VNWSFRRDRRAARHRRSTGAEWQIASEIAPRAGEPIVEKRFGDAFAQTTLTDVLAALDGDHLIVAGMQTDFCVNATIGGAAERGYRVTLVADGHATSASNGKSEQQIREAMHQETRARGARIISAADLFG